MLTTAEAIAEIRDLIDVPEPAAGADDPLSNTNILKWYNEGFEDLVDAIMGIPVYIEFTIDTGGTITVTNSTATPVVTAGDIDTTTEDHTWYLIPDVRSYGTFKNLATDLRESERSIMERVYVDSTDYRHLLYETRDYYELYDFNQDKGFTLLPGIIGVTNTIGINYKQEFVRMHLNTIPGATAFSGTGNLDDLTVGGTLTGTADITFTVKIDTAAATDTFKWSINGGTSWVASTVAVTGAAQTLQNGITVTFGAVTGHTLNDTWTFTAYKTDSPPSFFNARDEKYPIFYAAQKIALKIGDARIGKIEEEMAQAMREFIRRRGSRSTGETISYDKRLNRNRGYRLG